MDVLYAIDGGTGATLFQHSPELHPSNYNGDYLTSVAAIGADGALYFTSVGGLHVLRKA